VQEYGLYSKRQLGILVIIVHHLGLALIGLVFLFVQQKLCSSGPSAHIFFSSVDGSLHSVMTHFVLLASSFSANDRLRRFPITEIKAEQYTLPILICQITFLPQLYASVKVIGRNFRGV